jgi:hypothetical protein
MSKGNNPVDDNAKQEELLMVLKKETGFEACAPNPVF